MTGVNRGAPLPGSWKMTCAAWPPPPRSRRYNSVLSMLTLDIDHFKDVNDPYGHAAGNKVLKALVRTSKEPLRVTDIFARMGGEEFSAILPETNLEAVQLSAERLLQTLASTTVQVDDNIIAYTVSHRHLTDSGR